jgi:transposase
MKEREGRRKYDREFKEGALGLILEGGRTVRGVSQDLGIHESLLHRWKKEYLEDREHAFPGKGYMKPHEEEIFKLKKKIADLEEDQAILKKALAIFSKRPK